MYEGVTMMISGLKVLDQLHLTRRHAPRGRDDRAPGPLGTVVRAEAAGEQAVAVRDVHLVPRPPARRADERATTSAHIDRSSSV
jgi:hypothetical protein